MSLIMGRVSQRNRASRENICVRDTAQETQGHPSLNTKTCDVRFTQVGILTVPSFDEDSAISARLPHVVGTEYNKYHNGRYIPFSLSLQSGCLCIHIDHSPILVFNIAVSVVIGISNFRPKNDVLYMWKYTD